MQLPRVSGGRGAPVRPLPEWFAPALAFLASVALYARSLAFPLLWDDVPLVGRVSLSFPGLKAALLGSFWGSYSRLAGQADFYRPAASLSLWLDRAFWGGRAAGFHLTNVLAAALGAALLAVWMSRRGASAAVATLGALLFATLPLRVESVAFVSDRTDLFCLVFLLLFLALWPRVGEALRPGRLALACGALLLAAASKELGFLAPVALAWEVWADRGGLRVPGRAWIWLAAPLGLLLLLRAGALAGHAGLVLPAGAAGGAPRALALYGRLLLFPVGASAEYGYPPALAGWEWALGALAWLLLLAAAFYPASPRGVRISSGLAILFALPAALPGLAAARFLYLSAAFTSAAVAFLVAAAPRPGRLLPAAFGLCAVLAALTWSRLPIWESSLRLFEDCTRRAPGAASAWVNLGVAQLGAGDPVASEASLRRAILLDPVRARAYDNLALALEHQGRLAEARQAVTRALELEPASAEAHFNLAGLLLRTGRASEAARGYRLGLALREDPRARLGLAQALSEAGDSRGALEAYDAYEKESPADSLETRGARAWELYRLGRCAEALGEARLAGASEGISPGALYNLAVIELACGEPTGAAGACRRAIAADSSGVGLAPAAGDVVGVLRSGRQVPEAHIVLGLLAGRAGLFQARAREGGRYLAASPSGPDATLAREWATQRDPRMDSQEANRPLPQMDDLRQFLWPR